MSCVLLYAPGLYYDFEDFSQTVKEVMQSGLEVEAQDKEMQDEFKAADHQCHFCTELDVRKAEWYSKIGKSEKAIEHMRTALELNPLDAITHSRLASELYLLGQNEDAKESYALAYELNPKQLDTITGFASFLYNLENDKERAIEIIKLGLKQTAADGGDESGMSELLRSLDLLS